MEAIKDVTGLGVGRSRIIISVIGTDMSRFPTDTHLASWVGMYGVKYRDFWVGYYGQFNKERKINSYLKKLKTLGWELPVAMAGSTV